MNTIEAEGVVMAKTITVRVDEKTYNMFKRAAEGQKRTISNYLEYATLSYTISELTVENFELNEIMAYEKDLQKGLDDISAGRYELIG
jgi:predicted transcriptional regulator